MSSWQTDYVAEKLAAWLAWTVQEHATNSRGVSVHLSPDAARYIVETVIWEYEKCCLIMPKEDKIENTKPSGP